jgi:preprotein translocase subunit SecF
MSRLGTITGRLYRGEVSLNFVSRQRLWYTISGCILVISLLALIFRGLDYSVDFKGGSEFTVPAASSVKPVTQAGLEQVVENNGGSNPTATEVQPFNGTAPSWQVQTTQLSTTQSFKILSQLEKEYGFSTSQTSVTSVGASWGGQVTQKAVEALIAFLIVVVLYLSIAFEWRMAAAAFVALAHDIVITVGVYALTGFQVSPATVIGLLTILGYSLYDTVVVFDKVRENTAPILGTRKSTYSEAANLALNQTLVRSINTSLTALLPVTAILVVGTLLLGNGELKDLSLVLFVGMLSGTYSSICIATPVLADLKEREQPYKALAKQVALRAAGGRAAQRRAKAAAAAGGAATAGTAARRSGGNGGAANGSGGTAVGLAAPDLADADLTASDLAAADLAGSDVAGQGPASRLGGTAGADIAADEDLSPGSDLGDDDVAAGAQPGTVSPVRGTAARAPGTRQQPVRRTAAQRRPSGKKKRR